EYLARRLSHPRNDLETLPVGTAAAIFHGNRHFPGAGVDRPRDPRRCHLSRRRHRSAPADRGAVDGPDHLGDAVGIVRAGARYRDARAPRDEAVGLFVSGPRRQELIRLEIRPDRDDGPRLRQMLSRARPWTISL